MNAKYLLSAAAAVLAGCAGMAPHAWEVTPEIRAVVASPDRSDADRKTDERRKPEMMLAFAGVKPGMKVLEVGAGAGYSAELLARSTAWETLATDQYAGRGERVIATSGQEIGLLALRELAMGAAAA